MNEHRFSLTWLIKMKLEIIEKGIPLPEGVEVQVDYHTLKVKGEKGELERTFYYPRMNMKVIDGDKGKKIVLSCKNATKNDKRFLGTFESIIKNMIIGVSEGFVYKLKVCSSHFPMNVNFKDNVLFVKNFLGEKIPRTLRIPSQGVNLKIEGDTIILEGIDKALVGNIAGRIEKLTRITDKDRRRFQDGIFIIEKAGKLMM